MAFIKMSWPVIAPIASEPENSNPTYGPGMILGKAITANITPNFASDALYGDDDKAEEVNEFVDASIELGTTTVPVEGQHMMHGHTVSEDGKKITYNKNDDAPYVGSGFVKGEIVNNVKKYHGIFITKAKFPDNAESAATKGKSITWNTPTIKGTAIADKKGDWKLHEIFDTEQKAKEWLFTKANIPSESGGSGTEGSGT